MKKQFSSYVVIGLIIFAVIGVLSTVLTDPIGGLSELLKGIAIMLVIGAVLYFIVRRFYQSSPEKREQRAFLKAAKKSVKRHKSVQSVRRKAHNNSNLTSLKKARAKKNQSNPHLTVIEGKKGKKKNRASF